MFQADTRDASPFFHILILVVCGVETFTCSVTHSKGGGNWMSYNSRDLAAELAAGKALRKQVTTASG